MEWGWLNEQLKREHQRPGRCIACDEPLPPPTGTGRPRTLLCGARECLTTYWTMRRSLERELRAVECKRIERELHAANVAMEKALKRFGRSKVMGTAASSEGRAP